MNRAVVVALVLELAAGLQPSARPPQQDPSLTLCVVVDVTASMVQLPGLVFDREAADDQVSTVMAALDGILEPSDRVRFGRIARTVVFGPEFVSGDDVGRASHVLALPDADRYGPSPIWDAAGTALELLAGERGRRAVIIWTDGRASGNQWSRHDVARRAAELGIPIHVVSGPTETIIRLTETTGVRIRPSVYLGWLAAKTGGQFHLVPREPDYPLGNPVPTFRAIIDTLRGSDVR